MPDPVIEQARAAALLRESFETVAWAAEQVPPAFTHANPPWYPPDAWTVAMNIAHMVMYADRIALPYMQDLAAGGDGSAAVPSFQEMVFLDAAIALSSEPLSRLIAMLRERREREIALVESFEAARFNECFAPIFRTGVHGAPPHSPAWLAAKSFQHTWEHGNAVLRAALFAPR